MITPGRERQEIFSMTVSYYVYLLMLQALFLVSLPTDTLPCFMTTFSIDTLSSRVLDLLTAITVNIDNNRHVSQSVSNLNCQLSALLTE